MKDMFVPDGKPHQRCMHFDVIDVHLLCKARVGRVGRKSGNDGLVAMLQSTAMFCFLIGIMTAQGSGLSLRVALRCFLWWANHDMVPPFLVDHYIDVLCRETLGELGLCILFDTNIVPLHGARFDKVRTSYQRRCVSQ